MTTAPHPDDVARRGSPAAWQRLEGNLPQPADPAERDDLLWQELNAQFHWYEAAATRTRFTYQALKVLALVLGAAVTVLAAISAPAALTASLAASVVILEGLQQVFQFHTNSITYRSAAETLRQHAFLYAVKLDPYEDSGTRRDRLAALMREVTSTENATWATTMRQSPAPPAGVA